MKVSTKKDLDTLLNSIITNFKDRSEVAAIYMFGSHALGKSDKYSDLDIQIESFDLNKTIADIDNIVSKIDKPLVSFPINNETGNIALTIFWENFSLHHKLDIGFVDNIRNSFIPKTELVPLYNNEGVSKKKDSSTIYKNFNEQYRSSYDYYIGLTRYVKYYKRKKHLSAYKFYRSSVENYLKLLYFKEFKKETSNIGLMEYQQIEGNLDHNKITNVVNLLLPKNIKVTNRNTVFLTKNYLLLCKKLKLPVDVKFANKVVKFLNVELK